jgi:RNA polymerase sigma-70 factor (ECF subfamily)
MGMGTLAERGAVMTEARRGAAADLPDEEIVARVRAGETPLYELLVRRHDRLVYRAVRAVLRDEDEVEDAMQQAWLAAFGRLASFGGASRFSTWLVTIALNTARDRLRRRTVRSAGSGEAPPPPPTPEREVGLRELVAVVERAVDALPEGYRTVLVLRAVEGLGTADTAAALGVEEDVVKTRLHRARALLRERLAGDLDRAAGEAFALHAPRCDRVVAAVMARVLAGPPAR